MSEELEVKIEAINEEIDQENEKRHEIEEELKFLRQGKEAHEMAVLYKQKQQELADLKEINRIKAIEAEKMEEEVFQHDTNDFYETLKGKMYVYRSSDQSKKSKSVFIISNQPQHKKGEFLTSWQEERLVMRPVNHVQYVVDVPGISIISHRKTNPHTKSNRRGGVAKPHDPTKGVAPPQISKMSRNGKYTKSQFAPKLKVSGRVMSNNNNTGHTLSKRVTGVGGSR